MAKKFKITKEEWILAIIFAVVGFIFTLRPFLLFLDSLSPLLGLLVYYIIVYISLFILSHFGLIIWKFHIKNPLQVLGTTLITFAFFVLVDWESPLINFIVKGAYPIGTTNIYYQSEDGALFYFFHNLIGITSPELLRWLIYIISPFILVIIGAFLVHRVKLNE